MARVVVVGAGVGGLATAARLAAAGHAVTVCEAAERVGGKLGCYTRRTDAGTFRFDVGPTLLTLPDVFAELFSATGAPIEDVLALRRLDPIIDYRFGDGVTLCTTSDRGAQREIFDAALGAGAGAAWDRLLDRGAAMWRAFEEPILRSELSARSALRLLAGVRRPADLRAIAPGPTLAGLAASTLRDPRQRMMLERYATYEGSDPRRAPAVLAVVPYLEQRFGGWYLEGGLHRLAEALATRVTELGASLLLRSRVTSVSTSGGRVDGVRTADGRWVPAEIVVCNADAHQLFGSLLAGVRRRVPPADTLSGFVLMLGLRGRSSDAGRDVGHHSVLFGTTRYKQEFDKIFRFPAEPVPDPVLYVNNPADPAAAPVGHEAWYVLVNAPRHGTSGRPDEVDWSRASLEEAYADRIMDLLAARGLPVADRVIFREIRSPRHLERDTLAPGGAIYGRALHGPLATLRRPANRTGVGGLFLVGGSTHPGGGLPLVALSARIVAQAIGRA